MSRARACVTAYPFGTLLRVTNLKNGPMPRRFPALTALLLVTACVGQNGDASIRTDPAGIAIVSYPGEDRSPPLALREVLRIGGDETRPGESFYQVWSGGVGTDAAGRIYGLEREASRVVVFEADGRFVRSVGRAGGGPGELGFPAGLDVEPDGTIGVVDFSKRGLVRFAPDGCNEVMPAAQ